MEEKCYSLQKSSAWAGVISSQVSSVRQSMVLYDGFTPFELQVETGIFFVFRANELLFYGFFSCSFVAVFNGPTTSHKVGKLQERTEYQFRIQASNDAGPGPFSDVVSFVTTAQPPNTVKG